jgi:hypothetical protein
VPDLDLQTRTEQVPAEPIAIGSRRAPLPGGAISAARPPVRTLVEAQAHPAVLLDPGVEALALVQQLRQHRTPLVALSAHRLEPVLFARSVRRRRVPALDTAPDRWHASLLELAAKLEPRPVLFACSEAAHALLATSRRTLAPHFEFATALAIDSVDRIAPEAAIRRALLRGEPALEVQIVRAAGGQHTGHCVLAWAPAAAPEVVVTSVAGEDIVARSEAWLAARGHVGYARLIWSPDRFGRLQMATWSGVPGAGMALAHADGVDLAALAHAAVLGADAAPQPPRLQVVRRLSLADPTHDAAPLVHAPIPLRDPVPRWIAFLRGALAR